MKPTDIYGNNIKELWFKKDPGMEVYDGERDGRGALLCVTYIEKTGKGKRPFQVAEEVIRYAEEMEEFPEGELVPEEMLSAAGVKHVKSESSIRIESKGDKVHCIYADWIRFKRLIDDFGTDIREQTPIYGGRG